MARRKVVNKMLSLINCENRKVHVKDLKPKPKLSTFQGSLKGMFLIGQAFSLVPVKEILNNNPTFSWYSWRCFYALLSVGGQIFITTMCIIRFSTSTSLETTTPVVFYGVTVISMLMFIQIGRRWPDIVQYITSVEYLDPNFDAALDNKVNLTCIVIFTLALVEHILSLLTAFAGAMMCHPDVNLYEGFVMHFYPWIFDFLPYSPVLGVLTQCLHFQSTFIWSFADLFVICVSYYLTSRLTQINIRLLAVQGKYSSEQFWRKAREDYSRTTQLIRRVDDDINGIVFVSFSNNLFFICLQLFHTLGDGIQKTEDCDNSTETSPLGGYEATAYFIFSLIFLIGRSIAVSLIAAEVHSASTVPALVLYDVPSPVYCVEAQRFLDQVHGDQIALSGLQFFYVTRGLLLQVAGTIVTYELVMFQFKPASSPDAPATTTLILNNMTTSMP